MTTPRTATGMPCLVTQATWRLVPRVSSESRRAAWKPGRTIVPLPVTILKPRLSAASPGLVRARKPEMINASFGSATRHSAFSMSASTMMPRTAAPMVMSSSTCSPQMWCGSARLPALYVSRARRLEIDDQDLRAGLDLLVGPLRVGVERLRPAAHRHHDLAYESRTHPAGHPPHLADHATPAVLERGKLSRPRCDMGAVTGTTRTS